MHENETHLFGERIPKLVTLYRGMNYAEAQFLERRDFICSHFWASDKRTPVHYYEGAICRIQVALIQNKRVKYEREPKDFLKDAWAYASIEYPRSVWYCFGETYLSENVAVLDFLEQSEIVKYLEAEEAEEEEWQAKHTDHRQF